MNELIRKNAGITIISLVVSIIVMLILAGISYNLLSGEGGILSRTVVAVNEHQKATDIEKLRLAEADCRLSDLEEDVTLERFIEYLCNKGMVDENDVDYDDDVTALVKLADEYVYQIEEKEDGSLEIKFAGLEDQLAPSLRLAVSSQSSNNITVSPTVKRNDGGKIEYFIKENEEDEYELKGETENTSFTFTGLTQNKTYYIKAIATAPNGLTADATTSGLTKTIIQPVVRFTYTPNDWANDYVLVTATADEEEGLTLYIGESINSCTTKASVGIAVTSNKRIYALYKDSTGQYGGAAVGEVTKIDKTKPVVGTVNVTTNKVTVNASDTAGENEQASGVAKYALTTTNSTPATSEFQTSNEFTGKTQGTTYYAWAMDNAGNISTGKSTTTSSVTQPVVTFGYSPSGWTNGAVTVTALVNGTLEEGMTLYIGESIANCTTPAGTGISVSTNKKVYAVYKDSTGQYGGAAEGQVTKIDKTKPVVGTVNVTTNKVTVSASDTAGENEQASGVAKYALTTTNSTPATSEFQTSNEFTGKTQGTTYYAWAMDNAGNISTGKSTTTSSVTQPVVTFGYSPSGWTNGAVTVTAEVTGTIADGMTLYIGESIASCTTPASTGISVSTNKKVYAVYKDSTGQYGGAAEGQVTKIDKTKPVVGTVNVTTNKVTVSASDTAGENEQASGVAKYALTTTNSTPATSEFQTSNEFTGKTQGTTYYAWAMDNAGNISNSKSTTTSSVTQPVVTFGYSPSSWTNGAVTVTASVNGTLEDGMTLYIGESIASCTTPASTGISVSTNKKVYAVYKDSTGQYGGAAEGQVTKIDKTKPVVGTVNVTTNKVTVSASDTAGENEQASGVAKYALTTTNSTPATSEFQTSNEFTGKTQGTTYYAWAMDNAGNISTGKSTTTSSVTLSKGNITPSVTGWSGTTATVSFTTTTGYYIQTKVGNGNWSSNPASTGSATATASSGTIVYARLTDSSGQYNNGDAATFTPLCTRNVIYDKAGGTGGPSNTTAKHTSTFTINFSSNPTKTGYTFAGWKNGSTTYTAGGTKSFTMPAEDVTLVAQWTANTYTVAYKGNGATSGSTANSSHTYGTAKNLTTNGYARVGYDFLGWSTDSTAKTATYSNSQSVSNLSSTNGATIELFAVWKSKAGWINEIVLGGGDVNVLGASYSTLPNEIWVDGVKQSLNSQTVANMSSGEHQVALNYVGTNFTSMNSMFYGCSSIERLDLCGLDTSSVSFMNLVFFGCTSLGTLILPNSGASSVLSARYIFGFCTAELQIPARYETMYSQALVDAINNYTGTKTPY